MAADTSAEDDKPIKLSAGPTVVNKVVGLHIGGSMKRQNKGDQNGEVQQM